MSECYNNDDIVVNSNTIVVNYNLISIKLRIK